MTKSSEGFMTSKEKVYAAYGSDGYKVIDPTTDSPLWKLKLWDDLIGEGASELLMWQNAADSLPPQPEIPAIKDGAALEKEMGFPLSVLCSFCESKPFYSCISRDTQKPMPFFHITRVKDSIVAKEKCDHSGCKHDNKGCCVCGEPKTTAESKPTLPEPVASEQVALPWEPGLTDEQIAIAEKTALTDTGTKAHWMATALALSMKLEEVMTKTICGEPNATGAYRCQWGNGHYGNCQWYGVDEFKVKAKPQSSLTSIPAPLVSDQRLQEMHEWHSIGVHTGHVDVIRIIRELQEWRKLGAAKGSK